MGRRLALLIATYEYQDTALRQLTSPAHDAEALAEVLKDPDIAGFEVTTLINEPHHRVGEAIGDFYRDRRRDDLTLLYFTGHGLKDDDGQLYLAMSNTRRDSLLFTALPAEQIDRAMTGCLSRQQLLILDCCYSGAFPAGRIAKADTAVHALERFQGRGRTVLTASDATQYSFEGNQVHGEAAQSVFTRHLVAGLRDGSADLDGDGDITADELYSYVHDRVVQEMPQQRPKKQDNVEGRTIVARNINWTLPTYLLNAIGSPIATDRRAALDGLAHLYRIGNDTVRRRAHEEMRRLTDDDSRLVSAAATAQLQSLLPEVRETPGESTPQAGPEVPDPVERMSETPGPVTDAPATEAPTCTRPGPAAPPHAPASAAWRDVPRRTILLGALAAVASVGGASTAVVLYNRDNETDSTNATPPDPVTSVLFSPDGKTLATASYLEPVVLMWNPATGRRVTTVSTGDHSGVYSMAFSPDGKTLATANGDNTIQLLDLRTRRTIRTLTGHTSNPATDGTGGSAVLAVAFSPDGKTLASGGVDHTVRLWKVATGRSTATITDHTERINSVAFSPDGKTLASGSDDKTVGLWNVSDGRPITTVTGLDASIGSVVFSPDGGTLAIVPGHPVTLWHVATERTTSFGDSNSRVDADAVAFSPDGKTLAIGNYDGTVVLSDLATTRTTATFKGHTREVVAVAFSPDGKTLATSSLDGTARLWDLTTSRHTFTFSEPSPTPS
ncbi:caspase family protein [Streptomyces sp. NPDC005303]|uniref:caspase, EACC1-associated type n=1 Tax=Streptomyces sp. NPDC005303 TaxID=3155713 RepID=UPI0033AAD1F4